ncbi:MAG: TDT family transporter [Solirubrobacteraceae bacterium]
MTITTSRPYSSESDRPPAGHARLPGRLLAELERPSEFFSNIGPNWFASVMGTGIVANAAALLPVHSTALRSAALVIWIAAAALLLAVLGATGVHWVRHGRQARSHALDPAMAPFYGAPPMAFLTVGAGALLVGHLVLGTHAAVVVDAVLWSIGTLTGLASVTVIPYLMFTRHRLEQSMALGTWLMPIVPPMVSAATGAALIPHLAAGHAQLDLLLGCYAMFGMSLVASVIVITLIWARLAYHGPGPAETIPTLWIVLGPLGQSVTAANLLATQAPHVMPGVYGTALQTMGLLYGVPVWGFAILWMTIAAAITISTARERLPFSLTWWSFTFPVGTVVTGTAELSLHTQLPAFTVISVALYVFLVVAWLVAATNTTRGVLSGRLLRKPTLAMASV